MKRLSTGVWAMLLCVALWTNPSAAQAQPDAGAAADAGASNPKVEAADVGAAADGGANADAGADAAVDPNTIKLRTISALLRSKKYPEAEKLAEEILAVEPANAPALAYLAEIFDNTNRLDQALVRLDKAIALQEAEPQLYIQLSGLYERQKDRDKALKVLDDCVARFDKLSDCYVRRAQFFGSTNQDRATADYKKALEIDPANRTALNNLASVHMAQCRFKEASVLLERYQRLYPTSSSGAFNLGTAYYSLGKIKEGIAIHEELLARRPNHAIALSGLALGHTLAGEPDKALEALAPLLGAPDPSPPVTYAAGLALLFKGDAAGAEAELSKAVAAAPRRTHFVIALAEAQRQLGKLDEAARALTSHKKISPTTEPYVNGSLALVLHSQGKAAEANASFQLATRQFVDYTKPEDLRYLLRLPPKGVEVATALAAAQPTGATKPTPKEGGCQCRQTGDDPVGASWWIAALLIAAAIRRRG